MSHWLSPIWPLLLCLGLAPFGGSTPPLGKGQVLKGVAWSLVMASWHTEVEVVGTEAAMLELLN